MLTLFFRKPMSGTYVEDGVSKKWEIRSFNCPRIIKGQSPPDEGLVTNIGKAMTDEAGAPIAADTLRQYDLNKGLGDVMRMVWS